MFGFPMNLGNILWPRLLERLYANLFWTGWSGSSRILRCVAGHPQGWCPGWRLHSAPIFQQATLLDGHGSQARRSGALKGRLPWESTSPRTHCNSIQSQSTASKSYRFGWAAKYGRIRPTALSYLSLVFSVIVKSRSRMPALFRCRPWVSSRDAQPKHQLSPSWAAPCLYLLQAEGILQVQP